MKYIKLLIAGGNSTLLVWGCPPEKKSTVIEKYLGEVEQVGFVETKNNLPFLNMMGNELCINGTLALAKTLKNNGLLYTSGYPQFIEYRNYKKTTAIKLTIPYIKKGDIILLSGIGYVYVQEKKVITKKLLLSLCNKYQLPAFGAIIYKNKTLFPYVYVQQTESLIQETACGSGSIALSLLKGIKQINQTTGKQIIVKKAESEFLIQAEVTELPPPNSAERKNYI